MPVLAQDVVVEGVAVDIMSNAPIELVSVNVEGTTLGTVTNAEGRFRLTVPANGKLVFSHLMYAQQVQAVVTSEEVQVFLLVPRSYELDEVIVSTVPPADIIREIVAASEKRLPTSVMYDTYYREFCKVNGKYSSYADGLLQYHVKRKKGTADLYVKQSRAMRVPDAALNKTQEDVSGLTFFEVDAAFESGYRFKGLLNIARSDVYDFLIRRRADEDGRITQTILFSPKEGTAEVLFEGSVTYDVASKLILEYDYRFAPSHLKFARERKFLWIYFTLLDASKRTTFRYQDGRYSMAYNRTTGKVHFRTKEKYNDTLESASDVVVLDYRPGDFEPDRKRRFKGRSLFEAGTRYQEDYWKTRDILLLSADEEAIVRSFESKP